MSRLIVILCLLSACAAPQRAEDTPSSYAHGTFTGTPTAPRVTRLPPGAPRPRVGGVDPKPFDPYAGIERDHDPRILPPTREPGIWASTPGDPLTKSPSKTLFGLPLPDHDDDEVKKTRRICARTMGTSARHGGFDPMIARLSEQERRCLAAKLFHVCSERLLSELENAGVIITLPIQAHVIAEALRKLEPQALDLKRRECPAKLPPGVEVLVHDIEIQWGKDLRE